MNGKTMLTPEPRYPFVHVDVPPEEAEETSARLFELGAEGVEERDETTLIRNEEPGRVTLVASFPSMGDAREAVDALPAEWSPRFCEVVGDGWRDAWKEYFHPFEIAEGVVVRPPWEDWHGPSSAVLELEPGRAFGTGLHETTRLVAQGLARHKEHFHEARVLDIGCGSGILGLVALALGARMVFAFDNDADAIAVADENAVRNGLGDRFFARATPLEECEAVTPTVLANIEATTLITWAGHLAERVSPGGLLFLSGILTHQQEEVRTAYRDLSLVETQTLGEWVLLVLRKG